MRYRRIFAEGHSYFLTMVTYRRRPLLIEHIEDLREAFRRSKERYDYDIDAIVVLPDHIHMIMTPRVANQYPKIISHIKRSFVYRLDNALKRDAKMELTHSKYERKNAGIWQERYYEHTIRDEKDWAEKMIYIRNNPVKHGWTDNMDDWKYSSFFKYNL